jgi:hypothetical protein
MVASILAVSTGWRCGTTITEVSSRSRSVRPARNANVESWSRHSPTVRPAHSPDSL